MRLPQVVAEPAKRPANHGVSMPVAVDHAASELAEPVAEVDGGPVLSRSSISHASLAAQRAQGRHSATSEWLPRCTMRSGSSTEPQHQHCPGGGPGALGPRRVRCPRSDSGRSGGVFFEGSAEVS